MEILLIASASYMSLVGVFICFARVAGVGDDIEIYDDTPGVA